METIRQNMGMMTGLLVVLLLSAIIAINVEAAEYGCLACLDKGNDAIAWLRADEQNANADNATSDPIASSTSLSMPQKSRLGKWNKPLTGFENEISQAQKQNSQRNMTASIASNGTENATIIRTMEAKKMLSTISEVSNSVVLLDISQNASEHIEGSIVSNDTAIDAYSMAHLV